MQTFVSSLLTGCYDNTIHIWNPTVVVNRTNKESKLSDDKAAHKLKIPDAHKAPVKVVSWIPKSANRFIRYDRMLSVVFSGFLK